VIIPVWTYHSACDVHPVNLTIFLCHCCFAFYVDHIWMPIMLKINVSPSNDGM
jgi:hypothetical protein